MNRSFRRVFSGTAVAHVAVVAIFLVVQLFLLGARPLKLKEDIQMIDLSGAAGGGGGDAGPVTPPPEHKVPDVKPPEDPPPPEPTKDDTIPEPVKPKPKPVKPVPKPKPTPKPAPQIKVAAPTKTNRTSRIVNNRPKLSADQVRALLSGSVRSVGSSSRGFSGRSGSGSSLGGSGGGGGGGSDSPVAWYYAMVKQIMYEAWQQPSGLANAGNPIASVTIRVKRDGTIADWQLVRPSGNKLMDDSVKRAVQAVKRLKPLPPQFIGPSQDITIQFELEKLLM